MRLRDVLNLKPGDRIRYGDHWETAKCQRFACGEILHVTSAGGVRVEVLEANDRDRAGYQEWVPYHHVLRRLPPVRRRRSEREEREWLLS